MDYKRMNNFRLLGLTIAYYRKARGMTQLELAEAVHISRTHMSNIEAPNGKTSISLSKLFDIAEALEVQVKDLFDFRDMPL
jgi:transcriptional regulator with XRE-family HTH domain